MGKSREIRKVTPWTVVHKAVWGDKKRSILHRLKSAVDTLKHVVNPGSQKPPPRLDEPVEPAPVQNRALSVRQPYVEQILRGIKKIEYRSKPTHIRGRVYLYASKTPAQQAFDDMHARPGDFPTGLIVGTVEIIDCTGSGDSYKWHLARPLRLAQPLRPQNHPQPSWFIPFQIEKP